MDMLETEDKDTDSISQDDIDALLSSSDEPADEPFAEDALIEDTEEMETVSEPEPVAPASGSAAPETGADTMDMLEAEDKDTNFISQDDIDALLSSSDDPAGEPFTEDALIGDTEESVSEPESVTPESEPAKPEPEDAVPETDADTDAETEVLSDPVPGESTLEADIDQLLDEPAKESVAEESDPATDQVILEEVPEEEATAAPVEGKQRSMKKVLLVALPAGLVLCGALGYVLYSYFGKSEGADQTPVQSFSINQSVDKPATAEKKAGPVRILEEVVNIDEPVVAPTPHFIALKGFLVPAPLKRKDLTYVTVDISIELTTSAATSLIKDHAAFYRNIIYDVLKGALTTRDKSKINEISLKIAILKALHDALPKRSVKDVIVDAFILY